MSTQTATTTAAVAKPRKKSGTGMLKLFFTNSKAVVGLIIFALFLLMAVFAPLLAHNDPTAAVGTPLQPPNSQFILGTTDRGQDVWAQLVWGTRTSLEVGLSAGFISTFIAVVVGMLGGYKGGLVDDILDTCTNIMLVIPGLPLIIVIAAYVNKTGPFVITLVIGLTGWAWGARTKRSQTMTFANRDFVKAAKLSGASDLRILLVEIMPNMASFVVSNFIFAALGAILAEAFLEFIGLGDPNIVSWGTTLQWADNGGALLNGAWWWFVPPGAAIALMGASFTLINFALDQVTNPRLRKPKKEAKV